MSSAEKRESESAQNAHSGRDGTCMSRRMFMGNFAAAVTMPTISRLSEGCAMSDSFTGDSNDDLVTLSLTEMCNRIQTKKISPTQLIQAHIFRFAKIQPRLNAVTHTAFAHALREARKAEQAIERGRVDWNAQPLLGVPFSVKNHIEVEGIPCTAGAPSRRRQFAADDAEVVRQLKAAGAIFIAATNLPCLALAYETDNLLFGRTNNPYDLDRTPGGSSGGEGALVAACGSPLGVGSDHNGSIRVPSAWNGIAGLRPAPGRLSLRGMWPSVEENDQTVWTIGPMARRVEDLELVLPYFVKPGSDLRKSGDVVIQDLRIRFLTKWDHGFGTPTAEIQDAVEASAYVLGKMGAKVKEGIPKQFHRIGAATVAHVLGIESFQLKAFRDQMKELSAEMDPLLLAAVKAIETWQQRVPLKTQLADDAAFKAMQQSFARFMDEVDALILPVLAEPAMKHGTAWPNRHFPHGEEAYAYCYFCLLAGQHPAGTVRVGATKNGLPVGIQVLGRRYREDIVLRILSELESAFGGWQAPPESNLT